MLPFSASSRSPNLLQIFTPWLLSFSLNIYPFLHRLFPFEIHTRDILWSWIFRYTNCMAEQGSEVTSSGRDGGRTHIPLSSSGSIVDSTPVCITNQKLTGNNFLPWSSAVELFITGRGKKDFLSEKMEIPAETDSKFAIWEAENSMIMSWLLGSMTPRS